MDPFLSSPRTGGLLKPREQRFIKNYMPFIKKISRLAMIKLVDL